MPKPEPKRRRPHDAQGAREAILDAAEAAFAQHGFDGARIDAIAAAAAYNKSLIFQYFHDKLGLYDAVVRRADKEMSELQTQFLASLFDDDLIAHPARFEAFLRTGIKTYFDFLVQHPRIVRIYNWEMAEGWQSYAKIISQRDFEDVARFRAGLQKVQRAGLLRSDFSPVMQLSLGVFICQWYLALVPMYQMLVPNEDFSSSAGLARAREYLADMIVHSLLARPSRRNRKVE